MLNALGKCLSMPEEDKKDKEVNVLSVFVILYQNTFSKLFLVLQCCSGTCTSGYNALDHTPFFF